MKRLLISWTILGAIFLPISLYARQIWYTNIPEELVNSVLPLPVTRFLGSMFWVILVVWFVVQVGLQLKAKMKWGSFGLLTGIPLLLCGIEYFVHPIIVSLFYNLNY